MGYRAPNESLCAKSRRNDHAVELDRAGVPYGRSTPASSSCVDASPPAAVLGAPSLPAVGGVTPPGAWGEFVPVLARAAVREAVGPTL